MGESSYASVAQKADRTNDDNKYRTLMEKLIQLKVSDWPKFQKHLQKLHSAEFYQVLVCSATSWEWGEIQCCSPNKNTCRIYHHKLLLKVQDLQQNSCYVSHQFVHQKALKTRLKKLVSHKTWLICHKTKTKPNQIKY